MEIKDPWTIVWSEFIDDFVLFIKDHLPIDHELQSHELYPGMKINGEPIFIVDDDTTGKQLLIDFNKKKQWKNTRINVPTIEYFENDKEVENIIERYY